MVGSVQNASQTDRKRGVGLWVLGPDASRRPGWETPFHVPAYVMGLGDGFNPELEGDAVSGAGNLVGLTNQVTIADIDANKPGLEMIFAGYDGKIHAVAADKTELWATAYAVNGRALTGGVVVADLSADGVPEIVFATYSPNPGGGALFVLSSKGVELHKIPLPTRGSMAVPTIGDADGNGTLDIVVSLKDENAAERERPGLRGGRLEAELPSLAHRPRQRSSQRLGALTREHPHRSSNRRDAARRKRSVPSDNSIGHGALFFASLCEGESEIRGFSHGEDNVSTVNAMRAMGVTITDERARRPALRARCG